MDLREELPVQFVTVSGFQFDQLLSEESRVLLKRVVLARRPQAGTKLPLGGVQGRQVLGDLRLFPDDPRAEGAFPVAVSIGQRSTLEDMLEELPQGAKIPNALDLLLGKLDPFVHLGDQEAHDKS